MSTSIDYNWKRGGFYFVTKEHGDCLYFDTYAQARQAVWESWGKLQTIYPTTRALTAHRKQERAMKVAS